MQDAQKKVMVAMALMDLVKYPRQLAIVAGAVGFDGRGHGPYEDEPRLLQTLNGVTALLRRADLATLELVTSVLTALSANDIQDLEILLDLDTLLDQAGPDIIQNLIILFGDAEAKASVAKGLFLRPAAKIGVFEAIKACRITISEIRRIVGGEDARECQAEQPEQAKKPEKDKEDAWDDVHPSLDACEQSHKHCDDLCGLCGKTIHCGNEEEHGGVDCFNFRDSINFFEKKNQAVKGLSLSEVESELGYWAGFMYEHSPLKEPDDTEIPRLMSALKARKNELIDALGDRLMQEIKNQ